MHASSFAPDHPDAGEPQHVFENSLDQDVLLSEHLRASLLALVFIVMILAELLVRWLTPAVVRGAAQALPAGNVLAFSLACLGYALLVRWGLSANVRAHRRLRPVVRYGMALIEAILATLATIAVLRLEHAHGIVRAPTPVGYLLLFILATLSLDFRLCLFTGVTAAASYGVVALVSLSQMPADELHRRVFLADQCVTNALFLGLAGALAGRVATLIRAQFVRTLQTVEQRNEIREVFGTFTAPQLVDQLLTQKVQLGGEVRHICVMFLDVRNFTLFSSQRTPQEVVTYLNDLFGFMIETVNRHHGIINKFLGDGFMAVFGAPTSDGQDSRHAVDAAREILTQVAQKVEQRSIPPTRVGFGLHAGDAVVGTVGSALRKEYTVIGDTVNVASRIEGLNKQFDSQLLISESVWQEIGGDEPGAVALAPVQVKGKEEPLTIYRIV